MGNVMPGYKTTFLFLLALIVTTSAAEDFELPDMPAPAVKTVKKDSSAEEPEIVDFRPIEATNVSDVQAKGPREAPASTQIKTVSGDTLARVQAEKIPTNLNRPLRVGVYTDVKELYLSKGGEVIHITVKGKELKFQGKENSFTAVKKDIDDGKCVSIAPTQKLLSTSCYPGFFTISYNNGKINAINTVDMEDYLRGVIPYEIGQLDSSRFEALKAQAVAARTYAYKHFGSRESLGFDVFADTKDQVYKGLQSATALTDRAVKETKGEVMMYNGEFITAYYHSTCGGMSETLDTWEKPNLPYLKSKPDLRSDGTPWCKESSYSKWERTFESDELVKLFVQNARDSKAKVAPFKKVKDITVKDLLKSGRILTLAVTTDAGTFEVRGDKVRWLFRKGGVILPSSFFTAKKDGSKWILEGKGFGHGVGMCQMGVRARAQAGQSYIEILSHYYPGITLERFER